MFFRIAVLIAALGPWHNVMAMMGGQATKEDEPIFGSIVRVVHPHNPVIACTGIMIGRKTVLTASHCTLSFVSENPVVSLAKSRDKPCGISATETTLYAPGATKVTADNSARNKVSFYLPDLALLQLKTPICGASPAKIAGLNVPKDAVMRAVGYGKGTKSSIYPNHIDVWFFGQALDQAAKEYVDIGEEKSVRNFYAPNVNKEIFSIPKTRGDAICFGDSGGPLYFERDGETFLVGVLSQQDEHRIKGSPDCGHSYLMIVAPVFPYARWIEQNLHSWELFE